MNASPKPTPESAPNRTAARPRPRPKSTSRRLNAAPPTVRRIAFNFSAPDARSVRLAGEFTSWEKSAQEMGRLEDGSWTITISLTPGQHEYRFIVDGQWADDPHCDIRKPNPFGGENCLRVVD
jgi:1,4-alpha-glucan branching enzyme